ncbi:MAG: YdeI/OmpD-associated family protein [Actinomycetota bacterium]|nr:YdeI/OmpD-associated family protein [Actinomycetota bacterium]
MASDQQTNAVYEGLSFTNRKEYARWVAEAARYETREKRAAETVRMLREGIRSPRR